jgi:hypothetical protein
MDAEEFLFAFGSGFEVFMLLLLLTTKNYEINHDTSRYFAHTI